MKSYDACNFSLPTLNNFHVQLRIFYLINNCERMLKLLF